MKSIHLLKRLEKIKANFNQNSTLQKIDLLNTLKTQNFNTPQQIQRFHDVLNFLYAFPDNREICRQASRMLASFSKRSDLQKFKNDLANTAIAGTDIHFQLFWPMACWLVDKYPNSLSINWDELEEPEKLSAILPLLLTIPEIGAMDEFDLSPREWVMMLKNTRETDAAYIINRLRKAFKNDREREVIHDDINMTYRLNAAHNTPNIANTRLTSKKVHYQTQAFDRQRPQLPEALSIIKFTHKKINASDGEKYIDLARKTMLTHERDLDAFSYGNPADVRLISFDDGHQLNCNSMVPDRRYLLHSTYGFLNTRNGIPIGYFQIINLYNSAEIAFNLFAPFRGGETSKYFIRNLAVAHQSFNVDTFILDPYQLGHENKEGLLSGVWWFYYKLGFRPSEKKIHNIAKKEIKKISSNPGYRSSLSTLNTLASVNMYFNINDDNQNHNSTGNIGFIPLGINRSLSKAFSTKKEKEIDLCIQHALQLTMCNSKKKLSSLQKASWLRWSPLINNIPEIKDWPANERRKVADIITAGGGDDELKYVNLLNQHEKLKVGIVNFANRLENTF